jgi:hypothetical protein
VFHSSHRSSRRLVTAARPFVLEPCGCWHGRLTAYIVREHQRGRRLSDILADRFLVEHASAAAVAHLLEDPRLIHRLSDDFLGSLSGRPDIMAGGERRSDGGTPRQAEHSDTAASAAPGSRHASTR